MKIKLFTHDDLDGVGCASLAEFTFDDVDIEYCNYSDIDQKIETFVKAGMLSYYDHVYITDISFNKEAADCIERAFDSEEYKDASDKITLIDHHQTALWMKDEYCWAYVDDYMSSGRKACGTSLFIKFLLYDQYLDPEGPEDISRIYNNGEKLMILHDFSEIVRLYDTYEWKDVKDLRPKQWNDLLKIIGNERMANRLIDKIRLSDLSTTEKEKELLDTEQLRISSYVDKKNQELIRRDILGYNAGIVFAENYISELGNKLSEKNPELDFIAMVIMNHSISFRTIHDNINLGKDVAKVYGGGGHSKAAGAPITDELREDFLNNLLNNI